MKNSFLIILCTVSLFSCSMQKRTADKTHIEAQAPDTKMILDSIISTARVNSLYTNNVNWEELEKEMFNRLSDNDSLSSLEEPIRHMMTSLGDFHGFVNIDNKTIKGRIDRERDVNYDFKSKEYLSKVRSIYQNTLKGIDTHSEIIDNSIAYIQIPAIQYKVGGDSIIMNQIMKIRETICNLKKNSPKGYIVDLRGNTGGNFWPMLSGLGELFPNMDLGGDTEDSKTFRVKWSLRNGNLYLNENTLPFSLPLQCNININNKKVAVLVGRYTASSGEAVASALKGQKNIKLFGEQTAGYSTTNGMVKISDNVFYNIATAYYMSSDSTVHRDGIIPDFVIPEDFDPDNPCGGETIKKAISWINYPEDKLK